MRRVASWTDRMFTSGDPARLFAVFEAYFDASGDPSTAVYTLAVLIAPKNRWTAFIRRWCAAMKRGGADGKILHMRELIHNQDQFEGWTIAQKEQLLRRLFPIIRPIVTAVICPSVPVVAYQRQVGSIEPRDKDNISIRTFALTMCLGRVVNEVHPSEKFPIRPVFEHVRPMTQRRTRCSIISAK